MQCAAVNRKRNYHHDDYGAKMSIEYDVTCDEKEQFRVTFRNAPDNLLGLRMSPDQLEPELAKGDWLVLCFAIWDSRDRPTIALASNIAIEYPAMQVAVRPFEVPDEFDSWAPEFQINIEAVVESSTVDGRVAIRLSSNSSDHPMWLKLRDGKLIEVLIGSRSFDEVTEFVRIDSETAGQ